MSTMVTSANIATELGVTRQRINILVKQGRLIPTGKMGRAYTFSENWREHYDRTKPKMGRPTKEKALTP
jgi:hypothetical protein